MVESPNNKGAKEELEKRRLEDRVKASTVKKLKERRRDRLCELVRLSKMLRVPPWGGPNGVTPLYWDEWRDSVASVVLVGHRSRPANDVGGSKSSRLDAAIKKSRRVVKNKVRDRLLLWDRFLFLLAELREEEFVSCFCPGDAETVCLTILDFPTIFVATRTLEKVARHLLPKGGGPCIIRKRFKGKTTWKACRALKRERRETPPRFKRWIGKLPRYLDEVQDWDLESEPEEDTPQAGQKCWSFGENGAGRSVKDFATYHAQVLTAKKKATQKKTPQRASGARKSVVKKVTRSRTPRRTITRKKVA